MGYCVVRNNPNYGTQYFVEFFPQDRMDYLNDMWSVNEMHARQFPTLGRALVVMQFLENRYPDGEYGDYRIENWATQTTFHKMDMEEQ